MKATVIESKSHRSQKKNDASKDESELSESNITLNNPGESSAVLEGKREKRRKKKQEEYEH